MLRDSPSLLLSLIRPLLKDAWERLESDDAYARREADVLLPFDGASNSLSEGTPASGPKATSKVDDGLLMQDDQQSLGGPDASPALGLPPWPTPCAGVSAKKKLVTLLPSGDLASDEPFE